MRDDGKKNVVGVMVDAVDYEGAVERITSAACAKQPLSVTALAVHGVMTGALAREHRQRLNRFDLITPDGQPVRWALNLLHKTGLSDRVYGPELTLRLCQQAAEQKLPIYLYGGSQDMLDKLQEKLLEKHPGLQIAGSRASLFRPFRDGEKDQAAAEIKDSGARIVFVGLGCPRQEVFVYEMAPHVGLPMIAVGAAFAFHSGAATMAPRWMQDRGLEWLYRLGQEPWRLWQRYLVLNPIYATLVAAQWTRVRRFVEPAQTPAPTNQLWG